MDGKHACRAGPCYRNPSTKDAVDPKERDRPKKQAPKDDAEEAASIGHRRLKYHEQKLLRKHGNFVNWTVCACVHTLFPF